MKKTDRIFIAGHNGLVGSSILELLKKRGFKNLITVNRKKLDLRKFNDVVKYFKKRKIDYMVMAAARAGGIIANSSNQKEFFLDNIEIQNSLLKLAHEKMFILRSRRGAVATLITLRIITNQAKVHVIFLFVYYVVYSICRSRRFEVAKPSGSHTLAAATVLKPLV